MRAPLLASFLTALLLLLAACPPKPVTVRPYAPPTAGELGAFLDARRAAVRTINARVRATSWMNGERIRATVLVLATRQGSLRFEAEVSLQGTVAALTTDGLQFAFYDAQKNELHRGPACPANVASLVRIPLAPAEVAAILLGDVDLGARLAAATPDAAGTVGWDPARGADLLTVATPKGTAELAFTGDPAHRALAGVTFTAPDGRRLWRTAYEDFETAGGVRLPKVIRFAETDHSFDDGVDIQFKDRTLNAVPRAEDFALATPPGAAVKDVGCAETPAP